MSLMDEILTDAGRTGRADQPYLKPVMAKRFEASLPLVKEAVSRGDGLAMAILGAFHILGFAGLKKDKEEGVLWLRQAANRGNTIAKAAIGLCLAFGMASPKNREEAVYWLFSASVEGQIPDAMNALCELVIKDHSLIGTHFSAETLANHLFSWGQGGHDLSRGLLCKLLWSDRLLIGSAIDEDDLVRCLYDWSAFDKHLLSMELLCDMCMAKHSLVGKYFSERELIKVSFDFRRLMKIEMAKQPLVH